MTREECIRSLMEEYARQRTRNEQEQDNRRLETEALDPEIGRLRIANITLAADTARRLCTLGTDTERRTAAEEMKRLGLRNNAEIRRRLKALGLPEDHLSLRYRCPQCRDTGLVGSAPSRFCDCFETRLHALQYEDGSMADTGEQNFERFDPSIFPEADGQRTRAINARRFCEEYADSMPDKSGRGILLCGEGGLGKTFLLNCIYVRAIERNVEAVRISAYRLFEAMRAMHMGAESQDRSFSDLLEVPLLLIDDLGTEPMMRNITVEYLFLLLNERMSAHRNTVICTNLDPVRLQSRYGERVLSRLTDARRYTLLRLRGQDLRTLRRP